MWRARLAALVPLMLLLPMLEAALIAKDEGSFALWITAWPYLGVFYIAGVLGLWALSARLRFERERLGLLAGRLFFAALWLFATYMLLLKSAGVFANKELSALLIACVGLGFGLVLLRIEAMLNAWIAARWPRAALAALGSGALVAALAYMNRAGFAQLDPWTFIIPALALGLGVGAQWSLGRALKPRAQKGLLGLGALWLGLSLGGLLFGELRDDGPSRAVAQHGPVGRYLAAVVQRLTDFDHDGHSSLMGGQDCAAFDPKISPDAKEIPGDGVDNNCLGGDARAIGKDAAPTFYKLPATWPDDLNVVVVTVEALRPDHVHGLGYLRETTPNLDGLLKESVLFERFYSASTFTRQALPALWTTRSPSQILWDAQAKTKMPHVGAENPWVPERFAQAGYMTLALQTDFPAFTSKDNIGFERGFKRYNASYKLKYQGGTMRGFPASGQVDRAVELFEEFKSRKFMMWLHMIEPHYMYEQYPGAPKFGDDDKAKYDSEIWGVDAQLGRLIQGLKERGLWEKTILFVTGDHGEEFGEHGRRFHGSNLYDPQTRTLGLLRVPGIKARRVPEPVGFVDVGSTLLNLAGVSAGFKQLSGRNLTAALVEDRAVVPAKSLAAPTIMEVWDVTTRRQYQIALVSWPYKLILSGKGASKRELYDLVKDPQERVNLWGDEAHKAQGAKLLEQALGYMDSASRTYRKAKR